MKKDYTHICIVLDASGSMSSIADDIKGSFNTFLEKQKEAEGTTVFDLFQFSNDVKRLVEHQDLSKFEQDPMKDYECSGCTALNDAVCTAIDTLGKEFAALPESERPENVLFVIITDGLENASKEYTTKDVKDRIEHQTEKYQWEFDFLAANIDAFETGQDFGLQHDVCMNFVTSPSGVQTVTKRLICRAEDVRRRKK